jgi:6-O-methylguanine DNA methyltransferase, DNA binding domain
LKNADCGFGRRSRHGVSEAETRYDRLSERSQNKEATAKERNVEPMEDCIVDIPKNRLGFFGGPGKMLLPGPATVAALIKKVPARKLITTNLICQKLTQQFDVQGTCPVTTQRALQAVAHHPSNEVPYWRVITANGGLIARFPGGAKGQAKRLRSEGFTFDTKGKAPRLTDFQESLVRL